MLVGATRLRARLGSWLIGDSNTACAGCIRRGRCELPKLMLLWCKIDIDDIVMGVHDGRKVVIAVCARKKEPK
jgi:hypothetical protein